MQVAEARRKSRERVCGSYRCLHNHTTSSKLYKEMQWQKLPVMFAHAFLRKFGGSLAEGSRKQLLCFPCSLVELMCNPNDAYGETLVAEGGGSLAEVSRRWR